MVFVRNVPVEYARGDFYAEAGPAYYLSRDKLESDYSPVRFARELRLFRRYCSSGRVLDVGCSSGGFLYQLNRLFPGAYDAFGTDVSPAPLNHAESRGVQVVRGNFLTGTGAVLSAGSFEAITFWAVLEHVADPRAFLDRAWELLKPSGICFVLVPNLASLAMRLLGGKYRYVYPQHLNYFSAATLGRLTAKFEWLEGRSTHFNPVVIWQDWRGRGEDVSNAERARLLGQTTKWKSQPLLAPLRWAYKGIEATLGGLGLADNLVVVLRRPS